MKQNFSTRKFFPTALLAGSIALAVPALLNSQTTTTTTPPKKPVPATAAKPAAPQAKAAVATTTPTAKTAVATSTSTTSTAKPVSATQTPATSTTGQSASQVVQPASSTTPATAYQPNGVASQNVLPATSSAGGVSSVPAAGSGQRGAVALQGVGSFLWGDWTAVIYGCFRSGSRVLCDFDTSKQNAQQANANQLWGGLNLVDDGGRVSARHNAFFLGDDGSQFQTGYISQTPVRLLMEYDDVSATITHATLVLANQRVQNVPITNADPSQPAGTIPARGAAQAPAATNGAPAAGAPAGTVPASNNPIDQAQNGVNNAQNQVNNANAQKQKAKSLWDSLKGAAQSNTTSH